MKYEVDVSLTATLDAEEMGDAVKAALDLAATIRHGGWKVGSVYSREIPEKNEGEQQE